MGQWQEKDRRAQAEVTPERLSTASQSTAQIGELSLGGAGTIPDQISQ